MPTVSPDGDAAPVAEVAVVEDGSSVAVVEAPVVGVAVDVGVSMTKVDVAVR